MADTLYIGRHQFVPEPFLNCSQELKQIDTPSLQRIVNGEKSQFKNSKKLWTRISFDTSGLPPRFDFERGGIIQIGCIVRLWKKVSPGKIIKLKYEICDNSIEGHDRQGQSLCHLIGDQEISIPSNVEFISYRPWLDVMITTVCRSRAGGYFIEAEEL